MLPIFIKMCSVFKKKKRITLVRVGNFIVYNCLKSPYATKKSDMLLVLEWGWKWKTTRNQALIRSQIYLLILGGLFVGFFLVSFCYAFKHFLKGTCVRCPLQRVQCTFRRQRQHQQFNSM